MAQFHRVHVPHMRQRQLPEAPGQPPKPAHIKQKRYLHLEDIPIERRLMKHFAQVRAMQIELPNKPEFNGLYLYKALKHV